MLKFKKKKNYKIQIQSSTWPNSTPGIMEILPGKININSEDFKSRKKKKIFKINSLYEQLNETNLWIEKKKKRRETISILKFKKTRK